MITTGLSKGAKVTIIMANSTIPQVAEENKKTVEEQKTTVQTYNFNLVVTEATQEQVTALAKFLKENGYKFKLVQ